MADKVHIGPWPGSQGDGGASTSGGGGDIFDPMEARVTALEKNFEKIDGKLDKLIDGLSDFRLKMEGRLGAIEGRLSAIEAKVESRASAERVSGIEGRLGGLADKWFVVKAYATLIAIFAALVALAPKLRALFGIST